ncbi:MAG: RidA family protein [Solirubrobacterales bacterium]|nr:RidA family protein [Solirubrobacterales bacterium]
MNGITEVRSDALSPPRGSFSQAIKVPAGAELLFVSGLTARDREGATMGIGDIALQTETILKNLRRLLADAGSSLAEVVKLTLFVCDLERSPEVYAVRAHYFEKPYPASSMVGITRLVSPDQLIEIEAIAVVSGS